METITVYKEIKSKEELKLNIEDIKNCYLKGQDVWNNMPNYLGIWIDKKGLKIVKINNSHLIDEEHYSNISCNTRNDIEKFMYANNKVQVISKDSFRKELDRIIGILEEVE